MAIYHLEAKVVSRGSGRSAVAASAYQSCCRMYNEYDGVQHDYTRKHGLIYEQILLPPAAPQEWRNREKLWNAVEAAETAKDSRLARQIIVALPVELDRAGWVELLTRYIQANFVSQGMCADVCVHDTGDGNPHAHLMLTVRPLNPDGTWQQKTEKEYLCICDGEEKGFTASEFLISQHDGWKKQYQYRAGKEKIYLPLSTAEAQGLERISKHPKATRFGRQNPICAAWNSEERLVEWRKAWADETNHILAERGVADRIDHRSHAERGFDELPTIHEGVSARAMEKRGITADRCEWNREIKAGNRILRELKATLDKILQSIPQIVEALENIHSRLIVLRYQILGVGQQKQKYRSWLDKTMPVIEQYKEISKTIKAKSAERRDKQTERDGCTALQFVKKHDLSVKINAITEEVDDLKSEKAMLISRLECADENEVRAEEKSLQAMQKELPGLDRRKAELTDKEKQELARYKEVSAQVASSDVEAVWDARANLRPAQINKVEAVLQKGYGDKYDHSRFIAARREIGYELGEGNLDDAALSIRRRLRA
ncbi:MAG TPA: MobQ family relaxase, partial [Candidatus Limiplasma sp.]|nr:MobQ family relaxase [Candidatus Limiplasma sp.]